MTVLQYQMAFTEKEEKEKKEKILRKSNYTMA